MRSPVTDTFTYTIRDGDGDLAHTTLTITIWRTGGLGPRRRAGTLALTVNEAALDLNKDGADLAAGTVTGSNPSLTTETAQNSAGNQLTVHVWFGQHCLDRVCGSVAGGECAIDQFRA